jgi:MFS family permease
MAVCVAGTVLGLAVFAGTIATNWSAIPWAAGTSLPLALLFAGRLLDGASGGTAATAAAVLADVSPPEKRAKAFGLIGVAFGLGFILGPALGGLLGRLNVNLPLLIAVLIAVLNLVLVLALLPETHPLSARIALPRKRELQPFTQLSRVFANPRVRRLCSAFFLFFLAFSGFTGVLVLYFKQRFGWGPGLAGAAFLVVGVVATVVQGGLIGPLVKRFGEWRLTLVGLGFVIAGCALVPLAPAERAGAVVFPAVACLALGTGLVTPCLRALVSRRLDDAGQGAALGSLQGLQSLGSFIGPPLAGLAYETIGRTSPFWLATTLLMGVMALVAGGLRRPNP